MWRQGEIAIEPLLCSDEIPSDRIASAVDRRGPTGVQNGGDLPLVNSLCTHLDVQPLVYFHYYITVTGEGEAEACVLIGDHSHMILSMARWKLLPHNAREKQQIM